MPLFSKDLNKFKGIFSIFLFFSLTSNYPLSSKDIKNHSFEKDSKQLLKKDFENNNETPYIVDSGDNLRIIFSGINLFSNSYLVSFDGYIFLPELNKFYVRGLTIEEIQKKLNQEYLEFIYDPNIQVVLKSPRPITISISGEAKRPGIYKLKHEITSQNQTSEGLITPKIFDALKLSQGLNNNADLSNIVVKRENAKSHGGGKIKAKIDIYSLLNNGDQSQNISLRDGDSIIIAKSHNSYKDQFKVINKSNLMPNDIRVYVSGNVNSPGAIILPQGASLYEAISAAGGKLASTGNINFIRFNENGKTSSNILGYKLISKKGSEFNPQLNDGDIINVNKNILGKASSVLQEFGSPIINAYGIYSLFND